jgi:hypothetical protein
MDPLQLAWAAGFFDGEGSTIVHQSRPGYLRLTVSVPQWGGSEPPEVLFRFKEAMLGLGEISPHDADGMWAWRSRSGEEGQAAIALIWSQIGAIKRTQAADALNRYHAQYGRGGIKPRPSRRLRAAHEAHGATRRTSPSMRSVELAWASGFLDGEGHFGLPRARTRTDGTDWRRIRVSASQHGEPARPAEVLLKLRRVLGGRIERHGEIDDHRWVSERALEIDRIFQQVRPWLGTVKQEQARAAIETFKGQARLHGTSDLCSRGHEYDHIYMSRSGPKRRCRACARIVSRRSRSRRGIKPRQFSNADRRYTF